MSNEPATTTSPTDPSKASEARPDAPGESFDSVLGLESLPPPWDRIFSLGTRLFVWGVLAGVIYILRPFGLLVFLTFVFAYILQHGVHRLEGRIQNRPLRVVLCATVFLGMLIAVGVFVTPHLAEQARDLQQNFPRYLDVLDHKLVELHGGLGSPAWLPTDMRASELLRGFFGFAESEQDAGPEDVEQRRQMVLQLVATIQNVGPYLLAVGSSFLLALLLSFLIVLDLPALERGVRSLEHTKLRFLYVSAVPNIREFGLVLGRALEAQLFIALCNTILTGVGLWTLGMTANLVFFSTLVFLFSFIPVVGVFISSTPICIAALTESGFELMIAVIVMITIVHAIEAYVLNPRIFGHHLRMNPVLVLIVLIIAGKSFGIWGLILGLPIVNYFFTRAIRIRPTTDAEGAADTGPGAAGAARAG